MGIESPRGVNLLQGEGITLFASAAHGVEVGNTGTPVILNGERSRMVFLLNVSAAATLVSDTLDVYVDVLAPDGTTWLNAIHFTQVLGNGGVKKFYAVLDPSAPGTSVIDATSDAAAGAVRPALFGTQYRGRDTTVQGGAGPLGFTFSLTAYAV